MYEHRLYSKDIRGFLMTSNSSASFFLLAGFAAIGLFIEAWCECRRTQTAYALLYYIIIFQITITGLFRIFHIEGIIALVLGISLLSIAFRNHKHIETLMALLCYSLLPVVIFCGLVMTNSKGGNGALAIGLLLLAGISLFGKRLWKYRLAVGVVLLIAIVVGAGVIIGYGVQNGRLPGGNSMLVRWQYWQSTAEMVADHGLTGVGGGNFADYYTHYKNAAASETIQNPHCWVLSLLSQYGPLGLAAFVLAIGIVCFKGLQSRFETIDEAAAIQPTGDKKFWVPIAVTTVVLMLTARPILMGANLAGQASGVWIAAYTVLYITPAGAFLLAFGLLSLAAGGDLSIDKRNSHLTIALICGLIAVLVHNLIDFAIFEPGVWSVVWLFAAVLIAGVHHRSRQPARVIRLGSGGRLLGCFGLIATAIIYGAVVVAPPVKATATLKKLPMSEGVDNLMTGIETAVSADPLSSNIPYKTARLLMQIGLTENPLSKDTAVFETALKLAQESQRRNPAGFKPCRLQSDIALMLAERSEDEQVPDCLENAYAALANAAERYPGSDDIQYKLGMVAEQRGAYAAALGHFKKALEFEMAYQAQFRVMYPDREPVVSRLGNTATTITRAKIEELTKKLGESASP
jgi:hypothetical protein